MKRHLVLTNGRSGSNYLVNLLNSHPHIINYGEVLGDWILPYKLHKRFKLGGDSATEYLQYIYSSQTFFYLAQAYSTIARVRKQKPPRFKQWKHIQSIGIKDFSINFQKRQLRSLFQEQSDLLVINLYRENALKRVFSRFVMRQTGTIKVEKRAENNQASSREKVYIPLDTVMHDLEVFERETHEQFQLIAAMPQQNVLNIRYEDLFESEQTQNYYRDRIFEFLNVEPLSVTSSHRKILSDDLSTVISNYEELTRAIEQTSFSKYLLDA
jgi:LPS sulfotransferase NodH